MWRSKVYLAFVRQRPCAAIGCSRAADVAHHFGKRYGGGGTGVKPHDSFTVPLCSPHHIYIHQHNTLQGFQVSEVEAHFTRLALRILTEWLEGQSDGKS